MESLSGLLIPLGTIVLIVLVQISFWFPGTTGVKGHQVESDEQSASDVGPAPIPASDITTSSSSSSSKQSTTENETSSEKNLPSVPKSSARVTPLQMIPPENFQCIFINDKPSPKASNETSTESDDESGSDNAVSATETAEQGRVWKCSCELGFLSAGVLKTFGSAGAVMRLGIGQCYHKNT